MSLTPLPDGISDDFADVEHPGKRVFLIAYAQIGTFVRAAERCGVSRRTAFGWQRDDPQFARLVQEAKRMYTDIVVAEIHRRAIEGVEEPIFQRGVEVGRVRKYSDDLLARYIAALLPEQYGRKPEAAPPRQSPINITPQDAARLLDKMDEIKRQGETP
jgi:hypothetical protein